LVGGTVPQGGGSTLTFSYRYDGLGRRIEKALKGSDPLGGLTPSEVIRYVYDNEDIILEYRSSTEDPTQNTLVARWLHGPGIDEPFMMERDLDGDGVLEETERFFYHADGLGSIVALSDSTGKVVERYRYDTFGLPTILGPGPDGLIDTPDDVTLTESAFGNPYLFTSREWDPETGLYFYRRRYYDSRIGRFLSEDPLGGDVALPQSFNLYPYVSSNPLRFTDPFGLGFVADKTAEELKARLGQYLSDEQIQAMATAIERAGVIGLKDGYTLRFGSSEAKEEVVRRIFERLQQKAKKDPGLQKLLDEFLDAVRKADPQQGAECPVP